MTMPPQLLELVEEFGEVGPRDRVQLLLELSKELPELPQRYADVAESMEQVYECQSPLFLAVEVEPADAGPERRVHLFFSAPQEAPTTRGFASILRTGLDGEPAAESCRGEYARLRDETLGAQPLSVEPVGDVTR